MQGPTIPVTIDSEIEITIPYFTVQAVSPTPTTSDTPSSFIIAARVVRVQDDIFAAQFVDLGDDQKGLLYKCFISCKVLADGSVKN